MKNPKYIENIKMGRKQVVKVKGKWERVKPNIEVHSYDIGNRRISFPIGLLSALPEGTKFKDFRHKYPRAYEVNPNNNIQEREEQERAISELLKSERGILLAPCAAGKTLMGCKIIERTKCKTLILVDQSILVSQWVEALSNYFFNADINVYSGKTKNIGDITVATVQSVRNNLDLFKEAFGCVIVDECHKCPSNSFIKILDSINAYYKYGFTATLIRNDGLEQFFSWFISDKVTSITVDEMQEKGYTLKPKLIQVNTGFEWAETKLNKEGKIDFNALVKDVVSDVERNNKIARFIKEQIMPNTQGVTITLSKRVEHIEKLYEMYSENNSALLHGKITGKNREVEQDRISKGEVKIIFGTIDMFSTGFNLPAAESMFIVSPFSKYEGLLIQLFGRMLRPNPNEPDKVPKIYWAVDSKVGVLNQHWYKTKQICLTKLNADIGERMSL